MDTTFARCYRLTKTDEYSSVFGFRRAIRGKTLMLHYFPDPENAGTARIGIVVAKKLLKRAVDRNRFKRVLREQFRLNRAGLPPLNLVVRLMAKPPVGLPGLAEEFIGLLGKLPRQRSTSA